MSTKSLGTKSLLGVQGSKSSTGASQLSEKLEKGFTVLILLLATGGLLPLLRHGGEASTVGIAEGDPVARAIWIGVYVATFALVAARWKLFVYVATRDKLLLLLVVLAMISVLWSFDPGFTIRRSFALVGTTLIGIYFAMRYSLGEQLRLLAWAFGIAALLSLLFALAVPSIGISSKVESPGAWLGIFDHKNTLGSRMALGALVFLLVGLSTRRYRKLAWASLGLSVGLILLSASQSSLVIFLTLPFLLGVYSMLRRPYTLAVPLSITLMLLGGSAATWLLINLETVLTALGRDVTLTGRTELWDAVWEMIWRSPWLGYGYNAFWMGWEGPSASVWIATGARHLHSHNGFLDLWLELGLVGIVVFVLGFLRTFLRAIVWARSTRTAEEYWPLMFLTFVFLSNITESRTLSTNSIFWILYVAVTLSFLVPRGQRVKTGRLE